MSSDLPFPSVNKGLFGTLPMAINQFTSIPTGHVVDEISGSWDMTGTILTLQFIEKGNLLFSLAITLTGNNFDIKRTNNY